MRAMRPCCHSISWKRTPGLRRSGPQPNSGIRNTYTAVPAIPVQIQPDVVLKADDLQHLVHVFGIQHKSAISTIAEYIVRTRPVAVVVETAVTPEHGARPGNCITCSDRLVEGPAAFYMRMFCSVAAGMQEQAKALQGDVVATNLWQQAISGAYRGEQLVYIAALAAGSRLVFGDRPKDITYRRLFALPTPAQLDEGFGRQAAMNYYDMLGQPRPCSTLDEANVVERISMQEREAVMCSVAYNAARGVASLLPCLQHDDSTPSTESLKADCATSTSTTDECQGPVVLVVGAAHVPGIELLWQGGRWQELLGGLDPLSSALMTCPPLESVRRQEVALRRGLLTALLRISASAEVVADVDMTLGAVSREDRLAYEAVCEIYGSTRTMLACLDRPLLDQVCQGVKDDSGQPLDFWEQLSCVRANRPSQGGPAFSEETLSYIRSLNFDLE